MEKLIINKNIKLKILEEIFQSQDFIYAQKYQELLKYIVNASIKGETIKETTIANDLFDKNTIFDPSADSSVRAYISNLRKKLDHYYLTDGKEKTIRLFIPKGHYHVEFYPLDDSRKSLNKKSKISIHSIYISIILLTVLISYLIPYHFSKKHQSSNALYHNPFWEDIVFSNRKTLIIIGDYYFFSLNLFQGRRLYLRDIEINSDNDLQTFFSIYPDYQKKYGKTYHTFLEEHIPFCLNNIIPLFAANNKTVEIKLASEVQLSDLQNYNIIYVGPYKTLYILRTIARNLNYQYYKGTMGSVLAFFCEDSNKVIKYSWTDNTATYARNDFPMVIKVLGTNNRLYIFFLSKHDFGNIATVKYFTDTANLKEFKKQVPSKQFEALFEVKGMIRTDFDIKLLLNNTLNSNLKFKLD